MKVDIKMNQALNRCETFLQEISAIAICQGVIARDYLG